MEEDADNKTKSKKPVVELTKKQELNNHIVLMRKVVRTARVHLINKLTKDVKKLKERKGDEKALEKTKRKVERFLQEIQAIKHLKEDKVSIFALQDKTKLEEVLQNPKASTEQRALSRFSHNKLIQGEVSKYRTQNIYWDLQLPVLLERSKDKRRRINKKLAEREAELLTGGNSEKQNKKKTDGEELSGTGEDSDSVDELDGNEEDANNKNSIADEDNLILDGELEDNTVESGPTTNLEFPTKEKPKPNKKSITSNKNKPTAKQKKQQTSKAVKTVNQPKEISKVEGTVRVQHLKNLADLENSESVTKSADNNNLPVKDLTKTAPKLRPKSSFFVGGVDEVVEEPVQEKRTFDKKRGQSDFQKNTKQNYKEPSEFKPLFRKGKLVNKAPKSFNNNKGNTRPSKPRGRNPPGRFETEGGANSNLTPLGDRKKESKSESIPNPKKQTTTSSTTQSEKLHPSWEAKKRQQAQPALSAFKGKKIKFDDD